MAASRSRAGARNGNSYSENSAMPRYHPMASRWRPDLAEQVGPQEALVGPGVERRRDRQLEPDIAPGSLEPLQRLRRAGRGPGGSAPPGSGPAARSAPRCPAGSAAPPAPRPGARSRPDRRRRRQAPPEDTAGGGGESARGCRTGAPAGRRCRDPRRQARRGPRRPRPVGSRARCWPGSRPRISSAKAGSCRAAVLTCSIASRRRPRPSRMCAVNEWTSALSSGARAASRNTPAKRSAPARSRA